MKAIILGLITGLAFGAILQRGRVCFNSAFRDLYLMKDNFLFKAVMFAIALEMLAFPLMAQFGWIQLTPKPLNWLGNIIGGMIFGMGMVLAGGCASGTTYRVGEGNTTSWLAALAFGLTAVATKHGSFNGFIKLISKYTIKVTPDISTNLYASKVGPTLATVLHINHWVVAIIVSALILIYIFFTKTTDWPHAKINWKWIGILLLPVAMFGYWSSWVSGRHYGLGITGGWISLFDGFSTGKLINWEGAEIIGIIISALILSLSFKEFKFRIPKNGKTYLQVIIGGMMMGFGAITAMGCNIGNFFTGIPMLSIGSIIAGICFILGNWFMSWILYGRSK